MDLKPVGGVTLRLRKIRLHQMRREARSFLGDEITAAQRDEDERSRGDDNCSPPAPRIRQNGESEERTVRCDQKRKAVDSRCRGDLEQRETFNGGVSREVPGKTDVGQMRAHEL